MLGFHRYTTLLVYCLILVLTSSANQSIAESLIVEKGKAQMLRLPELATIAVIGNPKIADVLVEKNDIVFIFGREVGETSLHILNQKGEIILNAPVKVPISNSGNNVFLHKGVKEVTLQCSTRCVIVSQEIDPTKSANVPTKIGTKSTIEKQGVLPGSAASRLNIDSLNNQ